MGERRSKVLIVFYRRRGFDEDLRMRLELKVRLTAVINLWYLFVTVRRIVKSCRECDLLWVRSSWRRLAFSWRMSGVIRGLGRDREVVLVMRGACLSSKARRLS